MVKFGISSYANAHAGFYAEVIKALRNAELADETDFDALLRSDVDVMVICSENVYHAEEIMKCAEAGKHVLVDMPIALNEEDARKCVDACKKAGVMFFGGLSCRHHPAYPAVKAAIPSLGKIVGINAENQGRFVGGWYADKKLAGGGAMMDHVAHVLDLIRDAMGSEVTRVYASVSDKRFGGETEDTGILSLDFENGAFATIDCSLSITDSYKTWGTVKASFVGTEGLVDMDILGQHFDVYSDVDMSAGEEYWGDDMNTEFMKAVVASVRDGKYYTASGDDCYEICKVIFAAYKSAETGVPVEIR